MLPLLPLAALAAPWSSPALDAHVALGDDWSFEAGGTLVEGQLLQAVHGPTGGGAAVRAVPVDQVLDLPDAVTRRVGDVEGALSADRYARALALAQEDASLAEHTVYLGFSDVAGPSVGRWVYEDGGRIWWHAAWRTSTHWIEWIGWAPRERLAAFATAMRGVEAGAGSTSGYAPPATLLLVDRRPRCEGPASLDRMGTIARTQAWTSARAALRAHPGPPADRSLAELHALHALVEAVDACVQPAAAEARACVVRERTSTTERSERLQEAAIRCVDEVRSR